MCAPRVPCPHSLEPGHPPVHAACIAATHATPSRPPGPIPLPASHARLSTRQGVAKFNHPLSFDTSSVTNMYRMLNVRSTRALAPTALRVGPSPCTPIVPQPPQCPHAFRAASRRASHARRSTPRQGAEKFNQPLSFNTSSVTNMWSMFSVRSHRVCPGSHSLESDPESLCMPRLRCRHPTPSRLPGRTSSRIACPPFDSAGRVRVQPAAQLRHVQRQGHEQHGNRHGQHVLLSTDNKLLLVRRQQAAHPLRVGGHLGLRLRWLWLELGPRDLYPTAASLAAAPLAAAQPAVALAAAAVSLSALALVAAASSLP